jgi:hypothetical protein
MGTQEDKDYALIGQVNKLFFSRTLGTQAAIIILYANVECEMPGRIAEEKIFPFIFA